MRDLRKFVPDASFLFIASAVTLVLFMDADRDHTLTLKRFFECLAGTLVCFTFAMSAIVKLVTRLEEKYESLGKWGHHLAYWLVMATLLLAFVGVWAIHEQYHPWDHLMPHPRGLAIGIPMLVLAFVLPRLPVRRRITV